MARGPAARRHPAADRSGRLVLDHPVLGRELQRRRGLRAVARPDRRRRKGFARGAFRLASRPVGANNLDPRRIEADQPGLRNLGLLDLLGARRGRGMGARRGCGDFSGPGFFDRRVPRDGHGRARRPPDRPRARIPR